MDEHTRPYDLWGYAAGSIGSGVFATIPGVLLLYYLTDTVRIPPLLAGVVLLLPKLIGVVIDPLVGMTSDRASTRLGRRTPFLILGTFGMMLSFGILFHTPVSGPIELRFLVALGAYLATSLSYSLFAVPYITMPSEMRGDDGLRTRVVALRMAFVFLGTIVGAALPPVLLDHFGGGAVAYGTMAFAIIGLTLPFMLLASHATFRLEANSTPRSGAVIRLGGLFSPIRDTVFRRLLAIYVLLMVASAGTTSALPYLIVHGLGHGESMIGIVLLVALGTAVICAPAWPAVARRLGELTAFRSAIVSTVAGSLLFLVAGPGSATTLLFVAALFTGIGAAGVQVFAYSLLARHIAARDEQGALTTGVWTGAEKLGLALGPALTAIALWFFGFSAAGENPIHSAAPLTGIRVAVAVTPILVSLLPFFLLSRIKNELYRP